MPPQNRLKMCRNICTYCTQQLTDEVTEYAVMMFVQQVGVRAGIGDAFVCVAPHVSPSHLARRRV